MPEEHQNTENQRKIVYRWMLNHARRDRREIIKEFTEMKEQTKAYILSLKDEYIKVENSRVLRPDEFEKNGLSLLHVAVLFGRPKVVKMLLPEGVDKYGLLMERTKPDGWLALHLCTKHVDCPGLEVVELLLRAYAKKYDLVMARSRSVVQQTMFVQFQGAFHDSRAMTPVHYATWAANDKVVEQLLAAPYLGKITFLHSVDLFLLTPLHICAMHLINQKDHPELSVQENATASTIHIAKLLIDAAANTKNQDNAEASMLGVLINAEDCCSYTPLHWAAQADAVEIVQLLLDQDKINPDKRDRDKKTPHHVAIESSLTGSGFVLELEYGGSHSKKLLDTNAVVKAVVDRHLKDRQICVESSNSTLVGASLVTSVTFAALLHPPLDLVTYHGVDPHTGGGHRYAAVGKDAAVEWFWIFNCISFLCAASSVITSSLAVRPKWGVHIRDLVSTSKNWLLLASIFHTFSILFVLGAFIAAGIALLPPSIGLKVRSFIGPGGIFLLFCLGWCTYTISLFVCPLCTLLRKFRKFVVVHVKKCTAPKKKETLELRAKLRGFVANVKYLTQASDRLTVSYVMKELESLRFHEDQSCEDCRMEALKVGVKALFDMLKVTQTLMIAGPQIV